MKRLLAINGGAWCFGMARPYLQQQGEACVAKLRQVKLMGFCIRGRHKGAGLCQVLSLKRGTASGAVRARGAAG